MTGEHSPLPADLRAPRKWDRLIALALALGTFAAMALTHSAIGVPRDESYYFRAGQDYAGWYVDVWDALKQGEPLKAFTDQAIVRRFEYNHEHPVLTKVAFGLSHLLFTEKLHWTGDAGGYRLPAWVFSGLLSALLYLMASRLSSRRGGLFAVAAFWLIPRQFFHGHLACFDIPIACMWLLTAYAYWRAQSSRWWILWTGVAFGLALSTKHNAWIIPGVFLVHFLLTSAPQSWREGKAKAVARAALPLLSMLAIGPVVFYLHWPYLWHAPIDRFAWYMGFHTQHINYPWEYFGRLLVEPPYPVGYAFGLTAMTVPVGILVLMTAGSLHEMARFVATYVWHGAKRFVSELDADSLLLLGNAFASITVLSMPNIPIFGGIKHWLPSMPFLVLFAARALDRIADTSADLWAPAKRFAFPLGATLALVPALWGVVHNHPYGTSFYNELAGGYPGGATLGMHRQYWSNNVTGVLPWLNQNAPRNARVFFHEVTYDSYWAYRKAGMLRDDLQYVGDIESSEVAVYQYMPEFRDFEMQIWNSYGTQTPVHGLYLDETPQIVIYQRARR
ncbi:MAG: glycosyltransferase family 39 protein [Myxococcales bacterium]